MRRPSVRSALSAFRRLLVANRGAAVIELAVVCPFLLLLLVGIVDLGRGFAARTSLHAALARTIEVAQAGNNAGGYDYLVDEAASAASVPKENVTLAKWLECDGSKKDFDETCNAGEETARFIEVEIESDYDPIFSGFIFGFDGPVDISVSDSLRVQ